MGLDLKLRYIGPKPRTILAFAAAVGITAAATYYATKHGTEAAQQKPVPAQQPAAAP